MFRVGSMEYSSRKLNPEDIEKGAKLSSYNPTDNEKAARQMVLDHFTLGYVTMFTPRREYNDMSVLYRGQIDQMAFNSYQPNNGEPAEGDQYNSWRSNAFKPVVRNKIISMAAHATASEMFPKVFAYNNQAEQQHDMAQIARDLIEWSCDQSGYSRTAMYAVLAALFNPCALIFTEYGVVERNIKVAKEDGTWSVQREVDEELTGFKDDVVPYDEVYIENIYENDIQKQGFIIWRKVISYGSAQAKYSQYPNWQYVRPGVQTLYNDANASFYYIYDSNMRQEMVEEVIYWNKALDVKLIMVNGILVTPYDNPNPRSDKKYPWIKFGYQPMDEGRFFYYKSFAFCLQPEANTVNELLPMIVDGTYLAVMPPSYSVGSEIIGSDVMVPGLNTSLRDPNSKLNPILNNYQGISLGNNILGMVNQGLEETAQDPMSMLPGNRSGKPTALEMATANQSVQIMLGYFVKMIMQFIKDYGTIRLHDIIQYMTLAEATLIEGEAEISYKSFVLPAGKTSKNAKKIEFMSLPQGTILKKDALKRSYDLLKRETESGQTILQADPEAFRQLKYRCVVTADILQPKSDQTIQQEKLNLFDKMINLYQGDTDYQNKIVEDFLLGAYPDIKNPKAYIPTGTPAAPQTGKVAPAPQNNPTPGAMMGTPAGKYPQNIIGPVTAGPGVTKGV